MCSTTSLNGDDRTCGVTHFGRASPFARDAGADGRRSSAGPPALGVLRAGIAPRVSRGEPRQRARAFVRGILAGLGRPNGWTLARYAGDDDPNGMQRLLNAARWDVDGVRDELRAWAHEHLAEPSGSVL